MDNVSSAQTAKRRKLDLASKTLSRPFISPLRAKKTPHKEIEQHLSAGNGSQIHLAYTPSTLAHTVEAASPSLEHVSPASRYDCRASALETPVRHVASYSSLKDPAELAAQKEISSLERQIKAVRNDIGTLEQAAEVSTSGISDELDALASKWRQASQLAADELFSSVKDRVDGMGGVAAMREEEVARRKWTRGLGEYGHQAAQVDDDADCEFDSEGEELPEEEKKSRRHEKKKQKRAMMDAADVDNTFEEQSEQLKAQQRSEDDTVSLVNILSVRSDARANIVQSFTMDMMLRSLNIDLQLIGYDKHEQRWKSE